MKAVMLSLRPQWCEKIFNGSKTIEVRKSYPSIPTPFKVYVYETKGRKFNHKENKDLQQLFLRMGLEQAQGHVIGSFVCDRIVDIQSNGDDCGNYWHEWDDECGIEAMCLSYEELETYLGKSVGYGWHITEPKLFDKPKELGEFYTKCEKTGDCECGDCLYLRVMLSSYPCDDDVYTWCGVDNKKPITRPPLSWCYVEDLT